jgi:hypothetical protein
MAVEDYTPLWLRSLHQAQFDVARGGAKTAEI